MAKAKKAGKAAGKVKIKMIGSVIGCPENQRATVRGLGLRRLQQVVEREDTPMVATAAIRAATLLPSATAIVWLLKKTGARSSPQSSR